MPDFVWLALFAGCGVALMAGPLGCLVVWRRMAYFGDTLAHSALTGVALGLMMEVSINVAVMSVAMFVALAMVLMQQRVSLATDTLLGMLSHTMLALGLVMVSLSSQANLNLNAWLFGDLLATSTADLAAIGVSLLVVWAALLLAWRPLLSMTVHEELAAVEGVPVGFFRTLLMLLLAVVIAVAMKVVGVLLITALLIIPAATARRWSHTPEAMACAASLIGVLSIMGGLAMSWGLDTPVGPSAVLCSSTAFALSLGRKAAV